MKNCIFQTILFGLFLIPLNLRSQITESFSVPGAHSWTVPPCVTEVTVQVWGAGGGGGSAWVKMDNSVSDAMNGNIEACAGGGGGGGGGFSLATYVVIPGQVYTIVVGAGGVAGIATTTPLNSTAIQNGGAGGTSSFSGNAYTLVANGGGGGISAFSYNSGYPTNHLRTGGAGGAGGIGTSFNGGNGSGGSGGGSFDHSGAGGGGAGTTGPGGNANNATVPHTGGTGQGGGGNGSNGFNLTSGSNNGVTGVIIGGGARGGVSHTTGYVNPAIVAQGGAGTRGEVRLIYAGINPPSISASAPQICNGESVTISANGAFSSYNWNTGQTGASIIVSPVSSTTYIVTGTDASGCPANNSTSINVLPAPSVSPSVSSAIICSGQSVNLAANPAINSTTVTYDFESSNPFTLSNGSPNNWYRGTAAICNGSYGLYIGTASTNNNYFTYSTFAQRPRVSFAFIDIPITSCNAELSFNWRCLGKSTDYLNVWIVPTSQTLTGGTLANELTVGGQRLKIGGDYWNSPTNCNNVTLTLTQGWVTEGQTIRLVFQWRNTGTNPNSAQNPAAMIDDVVISQFDEYNYSWSSTNTPFSATSTSGSESPANTTTYNLLTTGCNGCTRSSALLVEVDPCGLPIELITFNGNCQERMKHFNWSTTSENNNDFFTLEHSQNGSDFYPMQEINGSGNSTSQLNYSTNFTEEDETFVYYRLKQTDTDGASSYSDVIHVSCYESESDLMTVFPNPSNDLIVVNFNSSIFENDYLISITDMVGKSVLDRQVAAVKNGNMVIDVGSFSNGYYFLRLIKKNTGEQIDVVRFSKID